MAKKRMTFEKQQRDVRKKQKAEEKRRLRQERKQQPPNEPNLTVEDPATDEPPQSH